MSKFIHLSPSRSANTVTNFMGTAFLGGFLSDDFFTTYHIYLISAIIEFVGLVPCITILLVDTTGSPLDGRGLYALHSINVPVTFLSESATYKNKIPTGSPLTTIFKVLGAATCNTCITSSPSNAITSMATSPPYQLKPMRKTMPEQRCQFQVQPKASGPPHLCLYHHAQLLPSPSNKRPATMNTKLGSLKVPPSSLPVIPVLFIIILAPVYNHVIIPFTRKVTKTETNWYRFGSLHCGHGSGSSGGGQAEEGGFSLKTTQFH
ncbi:hypothetical protein HHK36_014522 [Tetracentron sinense]|uniref:Uncharacterized protein n=1 Tax=Tetracentron sinense TaxID=13715 RepID=A0A834Z2S8_TETSI|nr:hypothetical protein HHK36_014522 [Tetracentron sinense]